jgi:hypothetical protein
VACCLDSTFNSILTSTETTSEDSYFCRDQGAAAILPQCIFTRLHKKPIQPHHFIDNFTLPSCRYFTLSSCRPLHPTQHQQLHSTRHQHFTLSSCRPLHLTQHQQLHPTQLSILHLPAVDASPTCCRRFTYLLSTLHLPTVEINHNHGSRNQTLRHPRRQARLHTRRPPKSLPVSNPSLLP